ncbi:MAG: hypothetical protein NXI14_09385 [bacterium]|nr:hypothetical protein [bacterium]
MIKHTALFAALVLSVSASGGREDDVSRFLIGPDGRWHALPTEEEMAEASRGVADSSAFAEYAQRRLDLASLVTEVVFVDDDAPVGGNGASWQTAHQSLQDALAQDYPDRLVEIRMGAGTYRPDRVGGVNSNDPEASFSPRYEDTESPTGVFRITGGYAGLGASDPDANEPELYRTVITGDLLGDDGPDFTNYDDNTLVLFDGFNSELHGLVLEHARQAMVADGNLTIDSCVVRFNAGTENRGPFRFVGNMLVVKRCTFFKNRSGFFGGAVEMYTGNSALVSNRFLSNSAVHQGGAVFDAPSSSPGFSILQNNYFAANVVRGDTGSTGGAAAIYNHLVSAGSTVAFNRSLDGEGGGYGRPSWFLADHYTVFDVYHENSGISGRGLHEQFPSVPISIERTNFEPANHYLRGSFVQGWETSESNRPGSYASTRDSIRDNSGEEVLFVDLAGPDGIIGTPDDDPSPRPDSPSIDREVDLEGVGFALLDFADLNENGVVDEPLPFDLLGNPRSVDTPGIGDGGGIDAGAIEFSGDPRRLGYDRPMSGRRIDPRSGCIGDDPIRLYVDASAYVSGDGSSWGEALRELSDALIIARTHCGSVEIWLAAGTYLPDFSVPEHRASFRPTDNVTILGGFAGWEESADERDPEANPTVLSGDQFGNDDPENPDSILDNAYRVVFVTGDRGGGVIDGVTIRGGHARAREYAQIFSLGEGCVYGTGPYSRGGGVSVADGELELINCTVSACSAYFGAAVSVYGRGVIRLTDHRVLDDQFGSGCFSIRSQFDAYGTDSILVRPSVLSIRNSVLPVTATTTPFGAGGFANGSLELIRCDVDTGTRFGSLSDGYTVGANRLYVRDLNAESSLIRRIGRIDSANTKINASSLIGPSLIRFYPPVRLPQAVSLEISNCIVAPSAYSYAELQPASVADHCLYAGTNFASRCFEILVAWNAFQSIFVDFRGPDDQVQTPDGDYRLAPGSLAIDSGSNELVGSEFDVAGNDRVINGIVDRGAFEFTGTCTGDVDGDGVVDLDDINIVLSNFEDDSSFGDASGDGVVDLVDLNIVLAAFGNACEN